MKLSEIVQKIYDMNYCGECWVNIETMGNCTHIRIEYGDGYWGLYYFYINNQNKKIFDCSELPANDDWKWLWKLWVDNVEIDLDMEDTNV